MKVEIVIPVIICIMIGVLFFVGYLVYIRRITKKLGYSMMAIFFVFSCFMCHTIYKQTVALRKNAEMEFHRMQVAQETLRPSLPNLTASDIAFNAKTTSKAQMLSVLQNKQIILNNLYLTGVLGKDNDVVYAFADSAVPTVSKDTNIFFFGKGVNDSVNEKLKNLPKGKSASATVEFVDLQNAGEDLGFPVTAFIILIYNVAY